jgi:hypothetical protein
LKRASVRLTRLLDDAGRGRRVGVDSKSRFHTSEYLASLFRRGVMGDDGLRANRICRGCPDWDGIERLVYENVNTCSVPNQILGESGVTG